MLVSVSNECSSSPCRPDQVCEDLASDHVCKCPPGKFEKKNSNFCEGKYLEWQLKRYRGGWFSFLLPLYVCADPKDMVL